MVANLKIWTLQYHLTFFIIVFAYEIISFANFFYLNDVIRF